MKLLINILFIFFIFSCQPVDNIKIPEVVTEKKNESKNIVLEKESHETNKKKSNKKLNFISYVIGDPYFIDGVKYTPNENFNYREIGLATFYGKELHNVKTINNDLNKVTELLARHKTLPLPSIVKVTNIDNGLSIILKINDRHSDNSSLIQVSRKSAQLLKFFKNKIAKVRIEILSDPSKQMKIITQTMDDINFTETIDSAPTESVSISNLNDDDFELDNLKNIEIPIEIGYENIIKKELFLKVYGFKSFEESQKIIKELLLYHNFATKNDGLSYNIIIGPLENNVANNLVLSFISKGYKKTEFILE